jgi:CRP/FNR family transcriptional regulator
MRQVCLPCDVMLTGADPLDKVCAVARKVRKGDRLFQAGDALRSLYTVRGGFFKTTSLLDDDREQVTGFQMPGDFLAVEGIGTGFHRSNVIALEDSLVCQIPCPVGGAHAHDSAGPEHRLRLAMSELIVDAQRAMLLLGSSFSEERVAAFLLDLSKRYGARGFSRTEFQMRMSRQDVGSLLGLRLETVSRTLSKFESDGLLVVRHRQIRIVDLPGLKQRGGGVPDFTVDAPARPVALPKPEGSFALRQTPAYSSP